MNFRWRGHEYTGGEPIPEGKKFKEGTSVYYNLEKIPLVLRFKREGKGMVLAWDEFTQHYFVGISNGVALFHEDELKERR